MEIEPHNFYDRLSPFYHLLYEDWQAAIDKQGTALASLLAQNGVPSGGELLDSACGIGTQALGLAANGYQVFASDLSAGAVSRLQQEAISRGLRIHCEVDDLRTLACCGTMTVDGVIACDNSLPHLLNDADLLKAFRSALRVLKPGGVAAYSVRDYDAIPRISPDSRPYGLRQDSGARFSITQVWHWDGERYELHLHLNRETSEGASHTEVLVTRYYAVTIKKLMQLMAEAGFQSIARLDDVLFQPVIIGRKSQ